jgi:formiminotetrahydrofolate cyclodeaminase
MLAAKSLTDFLNELASNSPAPGGGSVAALSSAMGVALASMVCNLTIGKKKYADVEPEMNAILVQSESLRRRFTELVDKDTEAFNKVMEAFGLPRETDEQRALRSAAIQSTTKGAALVPLEVMRLSIEGMKLAEAVAARGNTNSVSDAGVSVIMLHGGLESAALNVRINLGGLQDAAFVQSTGVEVTSLQKEGSVLLQSVLGWVRKKMAG